MIFHQLQNEESGCLSYLVGCGQAGEAVVVDPGRDRVDDYLRLARRKGLRITRIVETHTHADHISGNRDLAALTQAPILLHQASAAVFEHGALKDGEEIGIGQVQLKVLHTPGHTPDSICLLVTDRDRGGEPWFVLTGDTLFIGDVGRPDLGGASAAGDLWESLRASLLALPDSVEVYPAHGAGSLCGRAMSSKSASTIGFERRFNAALRARSKQEFVDLVMQGLPPKPPSFTTIVGKNQGLLPLVSVKPRPYTAREAWQAVQQGACVVDLRDPGTYGEGHVPGALNVWIESPQFADRVSWFAPAGAPLILLAQGPSDLDRAVGGLTRVGVEPVVGFLPRGMVEWKSEDLPVETVPQLTVYALAEWLDEHKDVVIIDVREPFEWREGHVEGAVHLPMLEAARRLEAIPRERPKAVMCAGGLRSSTVISALKRHGISHWYNVTGGMTAWLKAGHPVAR
ncbi:MAG TPA: rhodanese-like domain-containing protein [Methylomirabilota bacterium]|jgi:glyoxylase-like metal-dependent hydrolase (beta-lactamase superfamily II)/rhodanese-related sulfurtransferase